MIQAARPEETMRKHARLLIVDDDPDLCDLVQLRYLEAEGFVISVVHSGAEGSHEGTSGKYDLIVLDVMLPDMKGFDVAARITRAHAHASSDATAKGDEFDRVLGLQMGGGRLFGKAI